MEVDASVLGNGTRFEEDAGKREDDSTKFNRKLISLKTTRKKVIHFDFSREFDVENYIRVCVS